MKLEKPVKVFMPIKDNTLGDDVFELTSFTLNSVEDLLELGSELCYDKEDPCVYTDELEATKEINRLNLDLLKNTRDYVETLENFHDNSNKEEDELWDEDDEYDPFEDLDDGEIQEEYKSSIVGDMIEHIRLKKGLEHCFDDVKWDDIDEVFGEDTETEFDVFSSKLVRFPYLEKIKLCRRKGGDKEDKNCIFITDKEVKKFIKDCDCKRNYSIVRNKEAYYKWSHFIDKIYDNCIGGKNE